MIFFDGIIFSLQKVGGISRYSTEILKRLNSERHLSSAFKYDSNNIFSDSLDIEWRQESWVPPSVSRYLPFMSGLPPQSLFHSSYYRVCLQKDVANVSTVHDFTYERYMHGFKRTIHSLQKRMAVEKSSGIICISNHTKKDLLHYFPSVNESRIRVVYNGVGDEFYPLLDEGNQYPQFLNSSRPFVLFVGDRSSYKNFDKAVRAIEKLPDMVLVVVGGKEFCSQENKMVAEIKDRVIKLKSVSSANLNRLYNHAHCLIYPSDYEGFGLPVLEAMKAGCPVIALDSSSIPEVAGDAAILLESADPELILTALQRLFDRQVRQVLRERGFIQASKFSWQRCYQETLIAYNETFRRVFGHL